MNEPTTFVSRRLRVATGALAGALAGTLVLFASAPTSWADQTTSTTLAPAAASPSSAQSQAALQVKAQELAAQVQADGRRLDQMAEALDAARLREQQLAAQLDTLRSQVAAAGTRVASARSQLEHMAVMAYVVGGAPARGRPLGSGSADPDLALSYAEIIAGSQKRTLDSYREALRRRADETAQVTFAEHQQAVVIAQLRADQVAAAQADSQRQQALAQVTGALAVLVAQVQATQQAAVRARLSGSDGQLASGEVASPASPSGQPAADPTPEPAPKATVPTAAGNRAPGSTSLPDVAVTPPTRSGSLPHSDRSSPPSTSSTTVAPLDPPAKAPALMPAPQAPGAALAIAYARAQLGKPYQWGGAGPGSFDCSGLTMMAWEQAGVHFPHLAQYQYEMTQRVPITEALPGDLIFFGTPSDVYHVGLYIGDGQMIDAPQTGQVVSIQSIYWSDLLGAGRVTG